MGGTIEMSDPQGGSDSGETPKSIDDKLVAEDEARSYDGKWGSVIVIFSAISSLFFFSSLIATQGWHGRYYLSVFAGTATLALSTGVIFRRAGYPKIDRPQSSGDILKAALLALAFGSSLDYFLVDFYPDATLARSDVLFGILFASAAGLIIISVESGFDFAIVGILGLTLPAAVQRWGPPSSIEVPLEVLIPASLPLLGLFLLKKGPSENVDFGILGLFWVWLTVQDPALENGKNFPIVPALTALAALAVLRILFSLLKISQASKAKCMVAITMTTVGIVTSIYRK
jgi:hypothetical protein